MPPCNADLDVLLDDRLLRRLAGARAFARGEAYFAGGLVGALVAHDGAVRAKVQGTRTYRIELWRDGDELEYSCTCPVGEDGAFCKHGVAVGLAWIDAAAPQASAKQPRPRVTLDDVRARLMQQDKRTLVDQLMDQVMQDDDLRRRLLMQAASHDSKGPDVAAYRQAIDEAVDIGGFVDYRQAYDYARGIDGVIDGLEALLKQRHAAEVIELAEHALTEIEDAMGSVDDSDGEMGGLLERLQTLHHRACKQAKPDPQVLAWRLFAWELRTDWDTFHDASRIYADILGKKGMATYRTLAEAEWAQVPTLAPGRNEPDKYGKRFRITRIMETLAEHRDDVEALVAIKQRDLSSAWAYLQIAELYRKARKHALALEWAERGLKAFPVRTDARLREFLADAWHRDRRHDEAMTLVWAEFTETSSLQGYETLLKHADRAGQRTHWRERALAHLRQTAAEAKHKRRNDHWGWHDPGHSTLVRIFLWEKDADAAWQEAQAGGCTHELWLELAARREKTHPQDALAIYQRQIAPTLDRTNNEAYRQAAVLLRKVRGLMVRLGRQADFGPYLADLRVRYKRKRNFIQLLDRARWT